MRLFKFSLGWFRFNFKEVIWRPFYFKLVNKSSDNAKIN